MNPQQSHHRAITEPLQSHNRNGSILIWSLLLGLTLTTVFFFMGVRQRATIAVQRDTAEIMNSKNYMESLADYLQKNPTERSDALDGIQIKLTRNVSEIFDAVDFGASKEYKFAGEIFIEWNKCSEQSKSDLYVKVSGTVTRYAHNPDSCISGTGYDDTIGPIPVADPFTIENRGQPFSYRITAKDNATTLFANEWRLELKSTMEYGKEIKVERKFKSL